MNSTGVETLRDTITPKSDQLNADDLVGTTKTITVTNVRRGSADQPVIIDYEGDNGRPYKPCKSMRRVLIYSWGDDGRAWVGRSMTLYHDPEVKFGGVMVGGIRISHLSHIDGPKVMQLTATRGKKAPYRVDPIAVTAPYPQELFDERLPAWQKAIAEGKLTPERVIAKCSQTGVLSDEQQNAIKSAATKATEPTTTEEEK